MILQLDPASGLDGDYAPATPSATASSPRPRSNAAVHEQQQRQLSLLACLRRMGFYDPEALLGLTPAAASPGASTKPRDGSTTASSETSAATSRRRR